MQGLTMAAGAASPEAVTIPTVGIDVASDAETDTPYNTILWNDPVNLTSQVTYVLTKVLGLSRLKAEAIMWAAHSNGRAVAFTGTAAQAEAKALLLLDWQLNATVEKAP